MKVDPIHQLLLPLIRALDGIGVTQEQILSGAIKFTELDWMAPPLVSEETLEGLPFSHYTDALLPWVDLQALYTFWADAMALGLGDIRRVANAEGWLNSAKAMPKSRAMLRNFWLSPPPSFPFVDDTLGLTFSLEVAHLARYSAKRLTQFVHDDDNYYAELPTGEIIGVKDGLPATITGFDMPAQGMVNIYLESTRGKLWSGCEYDLLAKIRSILWEHQDKLKEFTGLDLAVQTLRLVVDQRLSSNILNAVKSIRQEKLKREHDVATLKRCMDLLEYRGVSDARKVVGLRNMLVPAVLPLGVFRRDFYYRDDPPPMLRPENMGKIKDALRSLLLQAGALDTTEQPTTGEQP